MNHRHARYEVLDPAENGGMKYKLLYPINYFSRRYAKWVHVPAGRLSDGATGAKDLPTSTSWWVHDELCRNACFADSSPCTAWQASMVLRDILSAEGYHLRARYWTWFTFLFGSWINKAKVGWLSVKIRLKHDDVFPEL
jgi:hypothetical protein